MRKKKVFLALGTVLAVFALASCKTEKEPEKPNPPVVEEEKYTVTFDTQGADAIASQAIEKGKKATKPTDPKKEGYTFMGWYKESTCKTKWNFETDTVMGNVTLYAKWEKKDTPAPITYTVVFNTNGGSTIENQSIKANEKVKKPTDPTKDKYTFVGWFKDSECNNAWNFETDTVTKDVTLYAKWEKKVVYYTLSFNSNGGTEVASQTIKENEKATRPTSPTKDQFIFVGWYKDAELKTAFDFVNTLITKDITLYAKWEAKPEAEDKVKVIFNSKEGSPVAPYDNVPVGTTIQRPEDPTREGYTFVGWFKDTNGTLTEEFHFDTDLVTESMTLYAKWSANQYQVSFATYGGTSIAAQEVEYMNYATAPLAPTKDGYTFAGWYKEISCQNQWDFEKDVITQDTTIHAKWVINTYKVVFYVDGTKLDEQDVQYGNLVVAPQNPFKDQYTFVGWFTEEEGGTLVNLEETSISSNLTLYAHWTETEATHIQVSPSQITLLVNDTIQLNVVFTPENILNKEIVWTSSNEDIAVVDENGLVTAISDGEVTITATHKGLTSTCKIIVEKKAVPVTSISVRVGEGDVDRITLTPNHTSEILSVIPTPLDATNVKIIWKSSDPTVAEVTPTDELGLEAEVRMLSQGTEQIVITATVEGTDISSKVFCTADTLYGELIQDENLILNETFVGYDKDSKLPEWDGVWGTKGVYGAFAKNSKNPEEAVTYDTNYVVIRQDANGNNRAELIDDASMNGATKLVLDFGKLDGILKGYVNVRTIDAGNSWTPIQFYGSNKKEVLGIRFDKDNLVKYRLDSSSTFIPGDTEINFTEVTTLRIYFEFDFETGLANILINGEAFVTDIELSVKEVIGVQFVSSNAGAKRLSLDNIALVNEPLSLEDAQIKILSQLDEAYQAYDSLEYDEANWEALENIYNEAYELINTAEDKALLQGLLDQAILDMKAVETIEATALRESKEAALAEINAVDKSLYTLNIDALNELLEEAENNIMNAKTIEEVDQALALSTENISMVEQDEVAIVTLKNKALADLALVDGGPTAFTTDVTLTFKNDDGTAASKTYNNKSTYKIAYDGGVVAIEAVATLKEGQTYLDVKALIEAELAKATTSIANCSSNEELLALAKSEMTKHIRDYKVTDRSLENIPDCEVPEGDPEYYDKNVIIRELNDILRSREDNINAVSDISKIQLEITEAENYIDTFLQTYKTTFAELKTELLDAYTAYYESLIENYEEASEEYQALTTAYTKGLDQMNALTSGKAVLNATYRTARNGLTLVISCYDYVKELGTYAQEVKEGLPFVSSDFATTLDNKVLEGATGIKEVLAKETANTSDLLAAFTSAKESIDAVVAELKNTAYTISIEGKLDTFTRKYGETFTLADVHVTAQNVLAVHVMDAEGNYAPITSEDKVAVYENMVILVDVEDIEGFEGNIHWTSLAEIKDLTTGDVFTGLDNPYFSMSLANAYYINGDTSIGGKNLTGNKLTISNKDFTSLIRSEILAGANSETVKFIVKDNLKALELYIRLASNNGTDNRTGELYYNISNYMNDEDIPQDAPLSYTKASGVDTLLSFTNLKVGNVVRIYFKNTSAKSDKTPLGANLFIGEINAAIDETLAAKNVSIQWGETSEPIQYHYYDVIEAVEGPSSTEGVFLYWYHIVDEEEVRFESKAYPSGTKLVMLPKYATSNVSITYVADGDSTVKEYYVAEGSQGIDAPSNPVKEGYRFVGWFTEGDVAFDFATVTAGTTVTLTAKFEEITEVADKIGPEADKNASNHAMELTSENAYFKITSDNQVSYKTGTKVTGYNGALVTKDKDKSFIVTPNSSTVKSITIEIIVTLCDSKYANIKTGNFTVTYSDGRASETYTVSSTTTALKIKLTLDGTTTATISQTTNNRSAFFEATAIVTPNA